MEPALAALLFIGFAALIVLLVVVSMKAERERRERLRAFAEERGWSFWHGKDKGFEREFAGFECLKRGHSRYCELRMEGHSRGRAVVGFEYHYAVTTNTGKTQSTTHYRFAGLLVDSGLALEPLSIRNETFADKVGAFFGLRDIDFELDEFNRAFHVRSKDRRFAVDVIQQSTMELLLASPRFSLQLADRWVMAWRDKRFEAADFEQALALIEGLLERMPPSLVQERLAPVR